MSTIKNKRVIMSRRRLLGLVVTGTAGAIVLGACQPTATPAAEPAAEATQPADSAAPTAAPAPEEAVEIIVWGKDTTVAGGNKTAIDTFNAKNESIQIKAESVPNVAGQSADQMQKILTAIAAGTVPDFFYLDRFLAVEFASRNGIIALDEYINAATIKRDEFVPACWDEGEYKGSQWNIPASEGNIGYWSLAYNQDVMSDAGLDPTKPPTTWAETKEYAVKMTEREGNSYTRIGMVPLWGASFLYQWAWSNEGNLVNEDGTKITLTDPKVVESLEFLVGFYGELGGAESINAFSAGFQSAADDPFLTGMVGEVVFGEYQLPATARYKPDLKLGVTHFPQPTAGDKKVSWVGGWSWALPKGSKHPKEAFTAMEWLARDEGLMAYQEGQAAVAEADGGVWIPLIAAHLKTNELGREKYLTKLQEVAPYVAEGYEFYYNAPNTYDVLHFRPKVLIASLLWEAQVKAAQEACYGQKTALQALTDWQENAQTSLDEALQKTT
ncbi:MAG: extracellular solute-binding protein [Anaerolineae bacterium]